MKNRKQQTPARKRAQKRPTKRAPARSRSDAAPSALALAAECTLAQADALQAELARRLDEPQRVIVDVSALQRIDTAGLQLLAAFVQDRRTAGRAVEWRGRAAALDAAAGLLGLRGMLELAGEVGQ
ncbi:MAG TPA: STAS domain-containing protein [Steroidobacteraceae bacterium]|nr:STAS domain-containing protein [Steroidobacteraceae bacterium]